MRNRKNDSNNAEEQRMNELAVANNEHIEAEGYVTESIRGTITVELESGQLVQAYLCGKMKQNKILILPGDRVKVKITPYDMAKGIITRRIK